MPHSFVRHAGLFVVTCTLLISAGCAESVGKPSLAAAASASAPDVGHVDKSSTPAVVKKLHQQQAAGPGTELGK